MLRRRLYTTLFRARFVTTSSWLRHRNLLGTILDSVKILTTTQLYMLYNLCVISRYKTQAYVVVLRILKCCSKCFLTHNSNNSKKFFCKLFFFKKIKNMSNETTSYRIFRIYINIYLYILKLRRSCRAY